MNFPETIKQTRETYEQISKNVSKVLTLDSPHFFFFFFFHLPHFVYVRILPNRFKTNNELI